MRDEVTESMSKKRQQAKQKEIALKKLSPARRIDFLDSIFFLE